MEPIAPFDIVGNGRQKMDMLIAYIVWAERDLYRATLLQYTRSAIWRTVRWSIFFYETQKAFTLKTYSYINSEGSQKMINRVNLFF